MSVSCDVCGLRHSGGPRRLVYLPRSAALGHMGAQRMKRDRLGYPARRALALAGVVLMAMQGWSPALAGPREQARPLPAPLAGGPPTHAVPAQIAADIHGGNTNAAAQLATANKNFYHVTLQNFVARWA